MVDTDETLARQLQQGNRAALTTLVERHYDPLLGYLYRMTRGDRSLAQDLVQETFLRALRGIAGYSSPRPFKPWLYAIATNLARNHYASADARHTENVSEEADYEAEASGGEDVLVEVAEAEAVIAALDTLSDAHREVIVLYYYQSLPLQAIAEALGIPIGTVKSRLSNGVARLRKFVTEMPE
jgi:RNA polymerase sigma factor (sigma-70 family)